MSAAPGAKEERVALMMSADELKAIDDYRFANRFRSRSEAMRHLCRASLSAPPAAPAPEPAPETASAPPEAQAPFRWEEHRDGGHFAWSGTEIIGLATTTVDGDCAWHLDAVAGSGHLPATRGKAKDIPSAKRALRRAWTRWLADRGLVEGGG